MKNSKNTLKNREKLLKKARAKKELKIREARDDFWTFCQYMDDKFFNEDRPYLKDIAAILQKVKDGVYNRVALSMMPRAGKSYITTMFCAWLLGLTPTGAIMRNSYAERLAFKFSYDVRDIIRSDKYKQVFPAVEFSDDKTAVTGWNLKTAKQVSYFCSGVGGAITGFGCNLLAVLDDPVKNMEEALSEVVMDNKWNWFQSTHKTRLENNCPEVHIATRWSKRDIIGRLEDEGYFDYVYKIPALRENKSFCESIKTTSQLYDIKGLIEDFIWDAVYMQEPIEIKGLLYPVSELNRFKITELKGTPSAVVSATDIADAGDNYLCNPIAKVYEDRVYIVDVIYTQQPTEITKPLVAQSIIDYQMDKHLCESNAGGKEYAIQLRELVRDESICDIIWRMTVANKETRILMKAGQIKEHFYFRDDYKPGSDYEKFMNHLTTYVKMGKNRFDDAPDGLTLLFELIFKHKRRLNG